MKWSPNGRQLVCGEREHVASLRVWGCLIDGPTNEATYVKSRMLATDNTLVENRRRSKLTVAIRVQPHKSAVWAHEHFYRSHQQWAKVAVDNEEAVRLSPTSISVRLQAAESQLIAGNEKAYQHHCDEVLTLLRILKKPDVGGAAHLARVGAILPATLKDHDFLLKSAQEGATQMPDTWHMAVSPAPLLYRMRRFAEARAVLEQSQPLANNWSARAVHHFWLAMTYHQLDQSDKAKKQLATAVQHSENFPGPNVKIDNWRVLNCQCHFAA